MTSLNNLTTSSFHSTSLLKRMLFGGAIALAVIAFFLLQVHHPKPEWGRFWMIRPLIIVPLAGAAGGACYYFIDTLLYRRGWKKILIYVLSFIVYIIGLWMGIILGLDGTLWN
jgi:hypothetical protein